MVAPPPPPPPPPFGEGAAGRGARGRGSREHWCLPPTRSPFPLREGGRGVRSRPPLANPLPRRRRVAGGAVRPGRPGAAHRVTEVGRPVPDRPARREHPGE